MERVILLRVIEPTPRNIGADYLIDEATATKLFESHRREAGRWLQAVGQGLGHVPVRVSWDVVPGRAAEAIADYTAREGVDLLLMATHGRSGVGRWLMGSVAERVLHASCVPVLLVRPPTCIPKPFTAQGDTDFPGTPRR
ncbi:MAG: universal stress protein [Deferrisomatales bacterium]|nr:universal stress protein [Deferrisomatales bacterium]